MQLDRITKKEKENKLQREKQVGSANATAVAIHRESQWRIRLYDASGYAKQDQV